jgi:hypothetical protein
MKEKKKRNNKKHQNITRKKKKGGDQAQLIVNAYEYIDDIGGFVIYPTNIKKIEKGFFKNNNHDDEFNFPFYIQIGSDIQTKEFLIIDNNSSFRKINLFFYIKPNLYFSIRKAIFNSGIFATFTNIIYYAVLSDVIVIDETTIQLMLKDNVYTNEGNDILLNEGAYIPITSGPIFDSLNDWRNAEIVKEKLKFKAFKIVTNAICNVS